MKLSTLLFAALAAAGATDGFQFRSSSITPAVANANRPLSSSASLSPLFSSSEVTSSNDIRHGLPATALMAADTSSEEGEWTKARIWNTKVFRSAAILAALGAAGYVSGSPLASLPGKTAATIHLLSFGTWFGTVFYTTFIAGITMFKNL